LLEISLPLLHFPLSVKLPFPELFKFTPPLSQKITLAVLELLEGLVALELKLTPDELPSNPDATVITAPPSSLLSSSSSLLSLVREQLLSLADSSSALRAWMEPSFMHSQSRALYRPSPVTALTGRISEKIQNYKLNSM
jgi:hypothetical protein